jgi:AhpD family alkylhydroperoxidase
VGDDPSRRAAYRLGRAQVAALREFQAAVAAYGVDPSLAELVKVRASQINGCDYCEDLHRREALAGGVPPGLLDLLAGWRESDAFSRRERAALALAEAITLIHVDGVSDEVWREAVDALGEKEAGGVVWVTAAINAWNRLATTARLEVRPRG